MTINSFWCTLMFDKSTLNVYLSFTERGDSREMGLYFMNTQFLSFYPAIRRKRGERYFCNFLSEVRDC